MRHIRLLWLAVFLAGACSATPSPTIDRKIIGTLIEFHGFAAGDVDNQTPIGNGKVTFGYGERCEMDPRYHHWALVTGVSGQELLLFYTTDHPSPDDQNRNCVNGVLFVVSREKFDDIRQRQRFVENEREKKNPSAPK